MPTAEHISHTFAALAQNCKNTVSFAMSVRPSVRLLQLGPHWTDFHEICFVNIFWKSVEKSQVLLNSDKNNCTLHED